MDENSNSNVVDLPTEQAQMALNKILKETFRLKEYSLQITPGSSKGDNYIGIIYRVLVKRSVPSLDKELRLIVKMPPMHPQRREQFFARPCFLREITAYEELLPLFKQFQQEKGIDISSEGFCHAPFSYQCISENFTEAIFMQDLKLDGYEMYDRCQEMSYEHALKAIETLAKFHAVSFAINDQRKSDPAYKKCREMEDIWLARRDNKTMNDYMAGLSQRALNTLDAEKDARIYEKVKNLLTTSYIENLEKVVGNKVAEPYAIVCHGDFWTNNILFKHKDNKPVEAFLLDFQIIRYASPVTDLCYFFFTCTSSVFRRQHFQHLLDLYYEILNCLINKLGSNPDVVFPKSVFKEHMQRFGMFGVMMAVMLLPIFVAKSEEAPDLEKAAEKIADGEDVSKMSEEETSADTILAYNKRMRDVLYDAFDYNMIP
ncbi:uncharacterized protein LOC134833210 [Culicoides brevitarsis]|uniref:uncharacterized protein LOC134833210 n=1 Tax=Culicoides brevitarsis TaxID=469753 RepID=UPI00307B7D4E